jgi:hypothetical protein
MIEYLVTSSTRRRLLKLLWLDGVSGTVTELAGMAGVAFAGAYNELKAMANAGLANVDWSDGRKEFSANLEHPMAGLMRQLVAQREVDKGSSPSKAKGLRENLVALGLPVNARKVKPKSGTSLELLLAKAAVLAQEDASVARSLPVLFYKYREDLNFDSLKRESWKLGNKHHVGFFLELAGTLGDDAKLGWEARKFFDRRYSGFKNFFDVRTPLDEQLAEQRTPDLAKRWGLRMNMPLDAFESVFRKFVDAPVPA